MPAPNGASATPTAPSSTAPPPAAAPRALGPLRGVGMPHPPLLEEIVADALDPAYADAASRRSERPPRTRTATAVLLLVGGLVVGFTVGQERSTAPSAEQARSALVTDARQRTDVVNALAD